MTKVSGYDLSKKWFEFALANPQKVGPAHGVLFLYCVELCNRLGWQEQFGLPTDMTMRYTGIRNHKTYYKTLSELIEMGAVTLYEQAKNQHTSNIIGVVKFTEAHTEAHTEARSKTEAQHT